MIQDWFDYCGFTAEERTQASLGLSRLQEALHPNAQIETASNWEILEAASTVLRRIRTRWAQKILYTWAGYFDFLDDNPEYECDTDWFVTDEPLGKWPTPAEYPATFEELFEDFVTSEWYGAQRTRINIRSILRTLAYLFSEVNVRNNSVDDLIRMSPQTWNKLEKFVIYDYSPSTAEYYLSIYRDLFRFIVSEGWRSNTPFADQGKAGGREVSREQAIAEFWGALVDTSRDISEAYSVDEMIAMEQGSDPTTIKAGMIKNWVPKLPRYDIIDAVLLLMELPSPHTRDRLGFSRVRSVLDEVLSLKTIARFGPRS